MLTTNELKTVSVTDIETGHRYIAEINQRMQEMLVSMQVLRGSEWQSASDERYDLKQAKRNIQAKMGKIVAARMNK